MSTNPNLYVFQDDVDFSSIFPYPTIFQKPDSVILNLERQSVLNKPSVDVIDDLKTTKRQEDKQGRLNANLNTMVEQSSVQKSAESVNNTVESNLALKQGNVALFRELNNRDPTPEEIVSQQIGATTTEVKADTTKRELITIEFENPYTTDKVEFDAYLQDLIANGAQYKIIPSSDGSIVVQHTKTLKDKINKEASTSVNTIDGFLDKFDLISPTRKLNLYKLDRVKKEDIMRGLRLLSVDFTDITDRYELLQLLKRNLQQSYGSKIIQTDNNSLSLKRIPVTKATEDEIDNALFGKNSYRNSRTLSAFLNANEHRFTPQQIQRVNDRIDELIRRKKIREGLSTPTKLTSINEAKEDVYDLDEDDYYDSYDVKSPMRTTGSGMNRPLGPLKNRLAISYGQIMAGNDSLKNRKQFVKDTHSLMKKGYDVKSLIKNLL